MIVLSFGFNTKIFVGHTEQYEQTTQQYHCGRYALTCGLGVSIAMLRGYDMKIWIVWGYTENKEPVIWSLHTTKQRANKTLEKLTDGFVIEYPVKN